MKSHVISRSTGPHSPHADLRAQTRPGGDIEFVNVVPRLSSPTIGRGFNPGGPDDKIVGVMDKKDVPALIEFLKDSL